MNRLQRLYLVNKNKYKGMKFLPGTVVYITKDMLDSMKHFRHDCYAITLYTYRSEFGHSDKHKSYGLLVRDKDGKWGESCWYEEYQLTKVNDKKLIKQFEKELSKRK